MISKLNGSESKWTVFEKGRSWRSSIPKTIHSNYLYFPLAGFIFRVPNFCIGRHLDENVFLQHYDFPKLYIIISINTFVDKVKNVQHNVQLVITD